MTNAKRIETWVWVLVYLGLATLGLGLSVSRSSAPMGGVMSAFGVALVIAGAVLIYLRSKIEDVDLKATDKPSTGKPISQTEKKK